MWILRVILFLFGEEGKQTWPGWVMKLTIYLLRFRSDSQLNNSYMCHPLALIRLILRPMSFPSLFFVVEQQVLLFQYPVCLCTASEECALCINLNLYPIDNRPGGYKFSSAQLAIESHTVRYHSPGTSIRIVFVSLVSLQVLPLLSITVLRQQILTVAAETLLQSTERSGSER